MRWTPDRCERGHPTTMRSMMVADSRSISLAEARQTLSAQMHKGRIKPAESGSTNLVMLPRAISINQPKRGSHVQLPSESSSAVMETRMGFPEWEQKQLATLCVTDPRPSHFIRVTAMSNRQSTSLLYRQSSSDSSLSMSWLHHASDDPAHPG